jgi:hypothetical protein
MQMPLSFINKLKNYSSYRSYIILNHGSNEEDYI